MVESERRIVALIPARGGSKGIPRKNLVPVAGKPLLAYSVEHALATPEVDRVVVSTDDGEIARAAAEWGADVVRRPAALAADEASSESALVHALDALAEGGYEPHLVVFLQATSPLRRPDDVSRAIATIDAEDADSLFSACPVHGFVWRRGGDGALTPLTYDYRARRRRQEIGEDLLENGSIYVFKPWVLRRHDNRLGGRIAVYRMDPLDSFQVDEPADVELVERLLRDASPQPEVPDLSPIRLLVLDFDGVMTDNRVVVHQDGTEAVHCDRSDGFGLERLRQRGRVETVVLSKEENPVVAARCAKLGLACFHGYDDKLPKLRELAAERGLAAAEIAYVGNDLNDLEAMSWCGVAMAVADAYPEARTAADYVTRSAGGRGAVREVCDLLLAAGEDSKR